ncbi:MAG: substrate-binding domain-containing protein [Verrucomicrobiota bacterium]
MKKRASRPFRVQVVVQENLRYFRDIVLGVRHHGFASGGMVFADRWLEHELAGDLRALVRRDRVDGIVAALHGEDQERRFRGLGVPVVNVSNSLLRPVVPMVTQDDVAVRRAAAEHLLACGCRSFAFWGQTGAAYSEERLAGFRAGLGRDARLAVAGGRGEAERSLDEYVRMRDWLARLEGPLGVFGVLDTFALMLMRAARELGRSVPEEVAVLGAGDEDFWVEFESVPLSSVRLPARRIGGEAARLLEQRMLRGARSRSVRLSLAGAEVVARKSTDVIFAGDEAVAKAVRFIRGHAVENPYVADVARAAGVSAVALQSRFRAELGRTVLGEITRVRVSCAQDLLVGTTLKMALVAERCGFPNSQRFSVVFREVAGVSPAAYRRRFRESRV